MNIEQKINQSRLKEENFIRKSLAPTFGDIKDEIIKAKAAQLGEVREWGGVKYKKVAGGWIPADPKEQQRLAEEVSGEGGKARKLEGEGKEVTEEKSKVTPEQLAEHAKSASEAALINATKMSTDPAVREAAHKEMMRRKNEAAQESFKAPDVDENGKPLSPMAQNGKDLLEKEKADKAAKSGEKGTDDTKIKSLSKLLGEYDYRYGEKKKMLNHIIQKYPDLDIDNRAFIRTLMSNPKSPEEFDKEFAEHDAHFKLPETEQILNLSYVYNDQALKNAIKKLEDEGWDKEKIAQKYPDAVKKVSGHTTSEKSNEGEKKTGETKIKEVDEKYGKTHMSESGKSDIRKKGASGEDTQHMGNEKNPNHNTPENAKKASEYVNKELAKEERGEKKMPSKEDVNRWIDNLSEMSQEERSEIFSKLSPETKQKLILALKGTSGK